MTVRFNNILFPTDFSDVAPNAVEAAKSMAKAFQAQLHCLYVVDDAYQFWTTMGPESIPIGPPADELIAMSEKRMSRFVAESLADVDPPVIAEVATGRPFAGIITYAREHDIDMIVMATHGRGAVAHMLLGSTTEKVVRKAPCGVLTIRSCGHEFVMP